MVVALHCIHVASVWSKMIVSLGHEHNVVIKKNIAFLTKAQWEIHVQRIQVPKQSHYIKGAFTLHL